VRVAENLEHAVAASRMTRSGTRHADLLGIRQASDKQSHRLPIARKAAFRRSGKIAERLPVPVHRPIPCLLALRPRGVVLVQETAETISSRDLFEVKCGLGFGVVGWPGPAGRSQ
jgi:hypothetical protein